MKRIMSFVLILNLCLISTVISQTNLIQDGSFEEASINADESITVFPEHKGIWFPYIEKDASVIISTSADEHQGTVINIQTSSSPKTKSFVGQRIEWMPKPTIYTVAFSAKTLDANTKPKVHVYLKPRSDRTEKDTYFKVLSEEVMSSSVSHEYIKSFIINNFWEYYVVDFDLSKVVQMTNTHNPSIIELIDSTEQFLNDFYIAFSCTDPNARIRVTEVSMSKK